MLTDNKASAGSVKSHYFFQDIWAAKKIFKVNPLRHIDIGSRVDGFVSHCLIFRKMEVIDIRPIKSDVDNLIFIQDDATKLSQFKDNELESISCLHAAEHFGLGRYGDQIDPDAYIELIKNIQRILKPNGKCYFSVPVGKQRVEFNAHRVFNAQYILSLFDQCDLKSSSFIDDQFNFTENITVPDSNQFYYECGCFEFVKL
ncbi:hypothetical protein DID76_00735 [Candidatus Marinamargulisbacteria bacterium SCGC AG-414-C22]|nr:hypothetical protein DID76_00735 [Candidatus Marinamargulisbacteria bacterium SCGC AG-414-C22]